MKTLVFHIFIFALIAFASASCNSAKKIGSHYDHYQTCLTELGVTEDELFSVGEVTNGQHKTKHEDTKQHKNGCIMQCVFEKLGLMIGADFDEEKMREYYIKEKGLQPGDQRIDFLSSCMEQTKNMEDKCDKSLGFIGCVLMNEVSLPASNEEA